MNDYEIIDDFLEYGVFMDISDWISSNTFPWYHQPQVAYPEGKTSGFISDEMSEKDIEAVNQPLTKLQRQYNFALTHTIYEGNEIFTTAATWQRVKPIIQSLEVKSLIRMKVNSYPKTSELVHHKGHFDLPFKHKGGILYINENDGVTVLDDGTVVESVPNRLLLFDSSRLHHSTTTTDADRRMNINFNYF